MVNQPLNPYAVTSIADGPSDPVHFGGTLTRDDLMMSLHDSPPKAGAARYHSLILMLLAVGVLVASEFVIAVPNEPPAGFVWIVIGFLLLFPWLAVLPHFTPGRRRRLRRIDALAANKSPTAGWLDDEHVVLCNDDTVLRAKWAFFGPALLFPTHILLPLSADSTHRVVFPWRFFGSVEDAQGVCRAIRVKPGLMVDQVDEQAVIEGVSSPDTIPRVDVNQTREYDDHHWPFDSDAQGQTDWQLDLTAQQSSPWFAVKAMVAILLFMIWYFLPVWVAVFGWLIYDYLFFGNWGFLQERIFSTVIVLGPAALLLAFFLYSAARAAMQLRAVQSKPLLVRLRDSGGHLSHATFDSWFKWSAVNGLVLGENRVGWIDRESGEEVQFPAACFAEREMFDAFCDELKKLDPAGEFAASTGKPTGQVPPGQS